MNSLLLSALNGRNKERPPIWFMRQAGRYLPEYRALRAKHSFLEMCHTPEIIVETTKLPIDLLGFDAAILFSDILMVPEAFGQHFRFDEGMGPILEKPLASSDDVKNLTYVPVKESLNFVAQGIQLLKTELKVPLIGFSGAPFTLASYLIEGKTSRDFAKTKQWMLKDPASFQLLLEKLTFAVIDYLNMQIDAGVQALQLFDSWAGILSERHFHAHSMTYLQKIVQGLKDPAIPLIYFCRGSSLFATQIAKMKPHAISLDWNGSLKSTRQKLPNIALQGNLDPDFLYAPKETLKQEVLCLLENMREDQGYIFNLGHGIKPDAPVDSVKQVIELVKNSN